MRTPKKILSAALLVFTAAGLVYYLSLPGYSLTWQKGARQAWELRYREIARVYPPKGRSVTTRYDLKGVLNMRVFDVSEEKVRVGFQISPVSIKVSRQRLPELEKIYSTFFLAEFSPAGKLQKTIFSNEIAAEDEKEIERIIRSFQVIIASNFFGKWETEETDSTGRYLAAYSLDKNKNRIKKIKTAYTHVTREKGHYDGALEAKVNRSENTFTSSPGTSWLARARGSERITLFSEKKRVMTTSLKTRLTLLPATAGNLAIWQKDTSFDTLTEKWQSLPKNRISFRDLKTIRGLKKEYGNVTLQSLAVKIFKKYKKFDYNGVIPFIELLRLYPEKAKEFASFILNSRYNVEQKTILLHALERAGHAEAQKALSSILTGEAYPRAHRVQAAIAFNAITAPTDEAITSLWETYGYRNPDTPLSEELSTTAILALGSIARKKEKGGSDTDRNLAREIKERIFSDISSTPDTDVKKKSALYTAAGNTGTPEALEYLESGLSSQNAIVRSSAVNAIKHVDDENIEETLCNHLQKEKVPIVREAVIRSLYSLEPKEETVSAIIETLPGEKNENVRNRMYRYLLKNRNFPSVRESLQQILEWEKSPRNRKIIIKAINSDNRVH